ncbi:MAG TPA: hypothetical protein VHH10_10690 [Rubrobacteraceae bacterium]|nr:hypothetical protein [Rubrobacteraceae bacterium]
MEKRPDHSPEPSRREPDKFFGLDVERMSPRAQVTTSLAVIVPVALAGVLLFAFSEVAWIWFTFCWVIFPAFGLLIRGIAGLSEGRSELPSATSGKERELLGALQEHGELTPAQAAMETSLSVAEADRMLKELAEGGHLDVRVRGGGLFYSLWEREEGREARRLEGR